MKMSSQHTAAPYYFVPGPSRWPLLAGMSLLMTMIGASAWVNDAAWGPYLNIAGIVCIIAVLYFWFGDAIGESERGLYNQRVDHAYRWSMSWFIFSEVMFFGAFFGALFYARSITKSCGPTSPRTGATSARPARSRNSRPCRRSPSRPSTPRCC